MKDDRRIAPVTSGGPSENYIPIGPDRKVTYGNFDLVNRTAKPAELLSITADEPVGLTVLGISINPTHRGVGSAAGYPADPPEDMRPVRGWRLTGPDEGIQITVGLRLDDGFERGEIPSFTVEYRVGKTTYRMRTFQKVILGIGPDTENPP